MANLIQISDFEGFYNISRSAADRRDLQIYIDRNEDYYLCELLGNTLKDLFISDLTGNVGEMVPQTQIYLDIYNPFCLEDCFCGVYRSRGMKSVLLGLIYADYIVDQLHQNTITGVVRSDNENSNVLSNDNVQRIADKRINDSVESWKAIKKYICNNMGSYPDYRGIDKSYSFLDII